MGTYLTVQEFSEDRQLGIGKPVALAEDAEDPYIEIDNTVRHYFAADQPILVENSDGYQEEQVISSVVYGSGSTDTRINIVLGFTDKAKFTTAKSTTVRVNQFFNALTIPSSSTIERWITQAERKIDEHCFTTWKGRTWEGKIAFDPEVIRHYFGDFSTRFQMHLPHVGITTPLVDGTDELEYWNGSEWVDCLDAGWTYGRDGDYWINEDWLFFRNVRPRTSREAIHIKFRYDQGDVPEDISEACSMLVARKFLRSNPRNVQGEGKPSLGEQWPYQSGAPTWAEIKGTLKPHVRTIYGV